MSKNPSITISDGGWTQWGAWTKCTRTCGNGTQSHSRTCTNPRPSGGGVTCVGIASETQSCNTNPCPIGKCYIKFTFKICTDNFYKSSIILMIAPMFKYKWLCCNLHEKLISTWNFFFVNKTLVFYGNLLKWLRKMTAARLLKVHS